jgi:hypothetical protein
MSHEARTDPPAAEPLPSPELRERVLRLCRQEMSERRVSDRRRQRRWRWSLATGVACLLLLNMMEERQTETRIAGIMEGRPPIHVASRAARNHGGLMVARARLLAALIRDPDSL